MKIEEITKSINEKLDKTEAGKIADDVANLLSLESARLKDIKSKDEEIAKLRKDKEMLIEANGNLLQQISAENEEILNPKPAEEKKRIEPFDMRSVFDEKGHFKKTL